MSRPRRTNKDGSPRKISRQAKLLNLPEADAARVAGWLQQDGARCCLQRLATELGITASQATLYEAVAYWESRQRRDQVRAKAHAQIEAEARDRGYTPAEKMAALDRRMAEIFAEADQHADYQAARYLIIADESARTKAELETAKLELRALSEARSKEALALEREKFQASIRTKVEAGLAEIAEQIKGNTAAEAALARMKEALRK